METAVIYTQEDLDRSLSKAAEGLIAPLEKMVRAATTPEYLTISEACKLLDCTRRHLHYLRNSGQINWIQNGRKIYFKYQDIREFMDDNYIEATQA